MSEHQRAVPGPGRRLGVDVGAVRVGVALSDPAPMLATPLVTLKRDEAGGSDLAQLAELGFEPGKSFDLAGADPVVRQALETVPADAAWKGPIRVRYSGGPGGHA